MAEMLWCPTDEQAQKVEGYSGEGQSQVINLSCGHSHPISNLKSPIFEVPDEPKSNRSRTATDDSD